MTPPRSFSKILHATRLHQEKLSTPLLFDRLRYVREIAVVFESESALSRDIDTHKDIRTRYGTEIKLCPALQLLTLRLCATQISERDTEHLLLPLLSEEVLSIDVAIKEDACTIPIPMHSLYSCIAKQAPKLERLLLPNSSSAGLSASHFLYLNTLSLQDLQGEDASAIAQLSCLRDLTVSCQRTPPLISAEDSITRMPIGTYPKLENLDLIASNVEALKGLLMLLPPLMTPISSSFEIRHSDKDWSSMLELLETCIAPSKLLNLELTLYRESDTAELNDRNATGLSDRYLRCFLPYTNLRRLYFNAHVADFHIEVTDEGIGQLAMNCPKLIEIVLEGSPCQDTSRITLRTLMYLAQYLDYQDAPMSLQLPLAAVDPPTLADCPTGLTTRTVQLFLPSDRLPIQSNAGDVFKYLIKVMPRIQSLQFGTAFGTQESWTSLAGLIHYQARCQRWPDQNIELYLK